MCLEGSHFTIEKHYKKESSMLILHIEMAQIKGKYNLTDSCFAVSLVFNWSNLTWASVLTSLVVI